MTKRVGKMRQERERRGLAVADVARALGIDSSGLSRIEQGAQLPRRATARALFKFYRGRVPLGDIFDPLYHPGAAGGRRRKG